MMQRLGGWLLATTETRRLERCSEQVPKKAMPGHHPGEGLSGNEERMPEPADLPIVRPPLRSSE